MDAFLAWVEQARRRARPDPAGVVASTIRAGYDEAAEGMTALANLGIAYDAVMRKLKHDTTD